MIPAQGLPARYADPFGICHRPVPRRVNDFAGERSWACAELGPVGVVGVKLCFGRKADFILSDFFFPDV